MYVRCSDCHLRAQPMFRPFSSGELRFVARLKSDQVAVGAHRNIIKAGEARQKLYTLLSGWAYRYKALSPERRQILDFLLPGDLIGLQSSMLGEATQSVCAITAVNMCVLDGDPIVTIFSQQPELAASLVNMLLREQERADMRLLLLGRQRPTERLAYLLLELRWRLGRRGMIVGDRCEFPLTYGMMSDATGMSRSQLAQSLGDLRAFGWASLHHGQLRFDNPHDMAQACGYVDPPPDQQRIIF